MVDFFIKVGDRRPELIVQLTDNKGVAVNLTGCTTQFRMRPTAGGALKVDQPCSTVDAATGKTKYSWAVNDTNTAGFYNGEFVVAFADGTQQTFPNNRHYIIQVQEEV